MDTNFLWCGAHEPRRFTLQRSKRAAVDSHSSGAGRVVEDPAWDFIARASGQWRLSRRSTAYELSKPGNVGFGDNPAGRVIDCRLQQYRAAAEPRAGRPTAQSTASPIESWECSGSKRKSPGNCGCGAAHDETQPGRRKAAAAVRKRSSRHCGPEPALGKGAGADSCGLRDAGPYEVHRD